jgi:dTDP-L-rhamnose 4-epimerase
MPRDTPYSGVAAIFRSALEAGRPPRVFEDGGQLRDFVHVTDVAAANLAALDAVTGPGTDTGTGAAAGTGAGTGTGAVAAAAATGAGPGTGLLRAYNVASGQPCTIGEMASALAGAFGGPAPEVTGQFRVGDVRHVVASPELAGSELGFHASISFRQGMAQFAHAPLRNPARRPQLAPMG